MNRLNLITLLTFAFSASAALFFLGRFIFSGRRLTSLALVPMCLGWAVVAALLTGFVRRAWHLPIMWIGFGVSSFMLIAIFAVEVREQVHANRVRSDRDR